MNFKAGKYYVGDPCYVIANHEWIPLLNHNNYFSVNTFEWKGFLMFGASTMFGDGCFEDDCGREYGVDSGTIGIVPYEYITEFGSIHGGNVIEFDEDFDVSVEDGVFFIGDIVINTSGDTDEEFCSECGYTQGECRCCPWCGAEVDDFGTCPYCSEKEDEDEDEESDEDEDTD